jgi:hypothetical protein
MNGLVFNMVGGGGGGVKLVSIAITTPPAKTTYVSGETFSPAGMIVTATYSNGATLKATGYSFSPDTALTDGTTSVTIEYTEGGVTKTAEQAITVVHRLTKIEITAQPTKKAYEYGDSFQSAGMVVKATYSDGATANVTGYSCSPTLLSTVGTQTITVSYTENGVTKTATTSVTVNRKTISAAPSQSGTLTYNGGSQSPTWNNYSTTQLTIGGTASGTNAGSYTATFTPKSNYRWADGTTTAKSVSWSIGKAAGSLSISPTSMTLDTTTKSKTITVTRSGNGTISAVSSNTAAATVSVSGNTVTVTGKANGSATITISVAAGTNYTAPANKTCAVTVSFLKDNFADNDWASIIAACHSGSVPSTWVVGNSKPMTINGASYQVDIIGKNHDTYASGGKAPLTFQLHDCYGETKNMNSSNTNNGGWMSCAMRSTHLPAILALMPTEVQNGVREVSKKASVGGASSTIETVSDKLFLLSEVEIFGSTSYSAAGEGTQYDYYKAGNSKVKKWNGSAAYWWERSPFASYSAYFCLVYSNGDASNHYASAAAGVAFGFCF